PLVERQPGQLAVDEKPRVVEVLDVLRRRLEWRHHRQRRGRKNRRPSRRGRCGSCGYTVHAGTLHAGSALDNATQRVISEPSTHCAIPKEVSKMFTTQQMNDFFTQAQTKASARAKELEQEARKVLE